MRNLGGICVLLGIAGFVYFSSQLGSAAPLPEGLSIMESLQHPAGRYEVARYAAAFVAAFGFLMALFPKGR
jgi:hypothetical protein